ncbi:MAG: adenosylcobalamin-dependent ribonucleoside-diphosphate reductase [Bacillota bacterium]
MELSENAMTILSKRYLQRNPDGTTETPAELLDRVARVVAGAELVTGTARSGHLAEKWSIRFMEMMSAGDFLPNSPTLMNAGRPVGQLSACFVLPVEDTLDDIFTAVKEAAIIHKSGGGTGFSFSRLRPEGALVKSTGGVASGPVSFIKVFDAATAAIKQGGTRRGANMAVLRVDHPDIIKFITCKNKQDVLANFNISVLTTRRFMEALEAGEEYDLVFEGRIYGRLPAAEVFALMVEQTWTNGEPGVVFEDTINAANPTPELGIFAATNPCGEVPLLPYESCNLGSVNLARMVIDNSVNWNKMETIVQWAIRFLDNVVEINNYPLPQIAVMAKGNRKIGLGVMGWADMLFQIGVPYDSPEAVQLAHRVMGFIQEKAHQASVSLGQERGSFPNLHRSIFHGGVRRNATCTTIAPTGTISMLAGTSSGIEPAFSLSYIKHVLEGVPLREANAVFHRYIENNLPHSEAQRVYELVAETGTARGIGVIPEPIQNIFVTSQDVAPLWHVRMQAAFQAHCDNAVSKTVLISPSASRETVDEVFRSAYRWGCKGVTVYRVGSRREEAITWGKAHQGCTSCSNLD